MARSKIEKIQSGIEKYQVLRRQLFATDVSADRDFQKAFNGFFRMGRRTGAYYNDYSSYLQQHKENYPLWVVLFVLFCCRIDLRHRKQQFREFTFYFRNQLKVPEFFIKLFDAVGGAKNTDGQNLQHFLFFYAIL